MKSIVFYTNSSIVGGHELMATQIMNILKTIFNIKVILSSSNQQLKKLLESYEIEYVELNYKSKRLQIISNWFARKHKNEIKNLFTLLKPAAVVLIQGNIDLSFTAALVAKELGIKSISYIPLTQPLTRTSRNKLVGCIKDFFREKAYAIPDKYITISQSQKNNLLKIVPTKDIQILPNYVKPIKIDNQNIYRIKEELSVPKDKFIVGYIGRLEGWHKGLNYYYRFLKRCASTYPNVVFLFIGSGPFEKQVRQLCQKEKNIYHIHWTDDINKLYSIINGLILPSRYEGVSLTMLEAISLNIPVIASNIPEFQEYIRDQNLFKLNDFKSLKTKMDLLISGKIKPNNHSLDKIVSYSQFKDLVIHIFSKLI